MTVYITAPADRKKGTAPVTVASVPTRRVNELHRVATHLPNAIRASRHPDIRQAALMLDRAIATLRPEFTLRILRGLPCDSVGGVRVCAVADAALRASGTTFDSRLVAEFLRTDTEALTLTYGEVSALGSFWRLSALEQLLTDGGETAGLANLNALESLAWTPFLEGVSQLEAALRLDPSGFYAAMTPRTRQTYRAAAQRHAQLTGHTESEVAQAALALAAEAGGATALPARLGHVGEYLIGHSADKLRARLGGPALWTRRRLRRVKLSSYLVGLVGLAAITVTALLMLASSLGASPWVLAALALLAAVPALVNGAGLVAWATTLLVSPRALPELDYGAGLPASARSTIVVPVLLPSARQVSAILARLERHYLGTHDPQVNMVLLSDFVDAPTLESPGDAALLEQVRAGIEELCRRHGPHFFLFHRAREWNGQEGTWMGYERKRGKLEQFNAALLQERTEGFMLPTAFPEALRGTRYVLTLDADTQMLPGTLRHLVGILAHPLNRPDLDPDTGQLRSGYTLLQPRLVAQPRAARRSLFTRLSVGASGPDLYSPLVSEAYHDLFDAAVFTGKGLYDVAAFSRTLRGKVPENALLSHDLFEGLHGRVGWVGDSVLLEDLPSHPQAYLRRLERWVRGDWALLPWLARQVPLVRGRGRPAFGLLGRWKIFHNLLRSLFAPMLLALLLFSWLFLPSPAWAWTLLAVLALGLPFLTNLVRMDSGALAEWGGDLERWGLALALLPQEAVTVLGAAGLAVKRLRTGRQRLAWLTAAQGQSTSATGLPLTPVLAVGLGAGLLLARPSHLLAALPLLATWTVFPLMSGVLSREEAPTTTSPLASEEREKLRRLARRTWLYFEHFVGPDDHWLPPDHFQQMPRGLTAHRTSPTNIGLLLLSTLTALDLGYLGWSELSVRLSETFDTLDRLERYRGHWLNWYDTQTLAPLPPRFVSTVDSGNLLGSLVALRQGLLEAPGRPIWSEDDWHGYLDTLSALEGSFEAPGLDIPPALQSWISDTKTRVLDAIREPQAWSSLLNNLLGDGHPALEKVVLNAVQHPVGLYPPPLIEELAVWMERLWHHLTDLRDRRDLYLPWLPFGLAVSVDQMTLADLPMLLQELGGKHPEAADALNTARTAAGNLLTTLERLAERTETSIQETQWAFLDNPERGLLSVGLNVDTGLLDAGTYDLLASEARLGSYLAVALGGLDVRHWTGLGRPMTRLTGKRTLMSWSGTMFEYLMPALLLRSPRDTLLDDACLRAIAEQITYARARGVPWGVSESGYSRLDEMQNYQYRAFGVPRLALHRDAEPRLIITPYASLLALPWDVQAVLSNMDHLTREGLSGLYGFYEAKDYGPDGDGGPNGRPPGDAVIIQSFMAHHQGMTLVSLGNVLSGRSMVEHFHKDPRVQTAEMLLYETTPLRGTLQKPWIAQEPVTPRPRTMARPWQVAPQLQAGAVHLLSGAGTSVLLTAAGGGASTWRSSTGEAVQLSRWRSQSGNYGTWIYLQDGQHLWAATAQPVPAAAQDTQTAQDTQVTFFPHQATFRRVVDGVESLLEVLVTPEGVEVRRLTLTNQGEARQLRVTLAAEVALNAQQADIQSPAFGNLGVESTYQDGVLVLRRRPGGNSAGGLVWAHTLQSDSPLVTAIGVETRRDVFFGRGGGPAQPAALLAGPLAGFTGAPLDPVLALSADVTLPASAQIRLTFLSAAGMDEGHARDALQGLAGEAALLDAFARTERAATDLPPGDDGPEDFVLGLELLSALVFPRTHLRPDILTLARNLQGREGLWAHGISGDLPILLLDVTAGGDDELVIQVLAAHRSWNTRGFASDLVLLNLGDSGYAQDIQEELQYALLPSETASAPGQGQVHLLRVGTLSTADLNLLRAAADVSLSTARGSLAEQLRVPQRSAEPEEPLISFQAAPQPPPDQPVNGLGAFSDDGREYVISRPPGTQTPAPWVNVLANALAGSLITESGASCTWVGNAGEFRLTPWSGDSVLDPSGEALGLHDPSTGETWTLPALSPDTFTRVRHGAGYTIFETELGGLALEVRVFVPTDAPLKVITLKIRNTGHTARHLEASYAVRWCLGASLETGQSLLSTFLSPEFSAVLARQPWSPEWREQIAFLSADQSAEAELPGALKVQLDCPSGSAAQVSFLLGAGVHLSGAETLLREYRDPARLKRAWDDLTRHWNDLLGAVQIRTPDPMLDIFMNRWLLYQTLSARIWGRTGFSQPGGAFGFRDQLQDVLSLLHTAPELARAHILECARHQFEAGDVLHWWHPPGGAGVRTHISDDLLWLPYALDEYARVTGDTGIFDEQVPYLQAEGLGPDEHERYTTYPRTAEADSLLGHALRAIRRADRRGAHGLPLIGTGDWNDGLNRVGAGGVGESVWLGFFLADLLRRFALHLDKISAADFLGRAEGLRIALETHGWDGEWYRRAYDDAGFPLGTRGTPESEIDLLPQAWAVLSGMADPARARQGLESARLRLWKSVPAPGMLLLLAPPYNGQRNVGYITAYPPGIRENGGQYTHAAAWAALAYARLGEGERLHQLLHLLLPAAHAETAAAVARYRREPYAVAGDISSNSQHLGMGGWSWYTGATGWIYRAALEGLLGIQREGSTLRIHPCLPADWPGYELSYRSAGKVHHFAVTRQESGGIEIKADGVVMDGHPSFELDRS